MQDANKIRIEIDETDKRGRVVVAVRQGDKTIAVETVNLLSGEKRAKFIEQIRTANPGLPEDFFENLYVELMRVAGDCVVPKDGENKEPIDLLAETPPEVKAAALAMLRDPNLIQIVSDDIALLGVAGERVLAMTVYVIGTSRLLPRPLAGIVQGPTSSGKSYIIDAVASLFPPEHVVRAHKMTPEALVHLPRGALVHRFVVAGERRRKQDDEGADATRALREMLSDGKLTKMMPIKRGGQIVTLMIEQPGPIAFVESTTHQVVFNEDRNRCLFMTTDETAEQTQRILDSMATANTSAGAPSIREAIVAKHLAAQRMLLSCRVVVPYAYRLVALFPNKRTEARRAFGHLLSLVKGVALLHQFQRLDAPATGLVIEATRRDYEIARKLAGDMFGRRVDIGLTPAVRRFGERLLSPPPRMGRGRQLDTEP
jgi:DNA primase